MSLDGILIRSPRLERAYSALRFVFHGRLLARAFGPHWFTTPTDSF